MLFRSLVLQAVRRSQRTMDQLLQGISLFPQSMINVRLKPGADWRANPRLAQAQADVTNELNGCGRVLIRPSGTEPLVRVMVEARDASLAQRCAKKMADTLA